MGGRVTRAALEARVRLGDVTVCFCCLGPTSPSQFADKSAILLACRYEGMRVLRDPCPNKGAVCETCADDLKNALVCWECAALDRETLKALRL